MKWSIRITEGSDQMAKHLGIYHNGDLDGRCSAAILLHELQDIELYGMNYGDHFPWQLVDKDTDVYMCDFSLPWEDMWKLERLSKRFVWLDHHRSAISAYERFHEVNSSNYILGIREIGKSACEITWGFFHPDESIPEFIKLLGSYDVWRNVDKEHWDNYIVPFEYGMLSEITTLGSIIWKILFFEPDTSRLISNLIEKGRTIVAYNKQSDAEYAREYAYEIEFEGLRALCINSTKHSSMILESVYDPLKHDVMIVYTQRRSDYRISFYSDKPEVDCSKIALKYGGGGHHGASGAQVKNLPFTPEEP